MGPTKVVISDPYPLGLQEILKPERETRKRGFTEDLTIEHRVVP